MPLNHSSFHLLTLTPLSINHSEITMIFVAASNMEAFLALAPNCPKLRVAVSIEALTQKRFDEIEKTLKPHSIRLMTLPGRTLFYPHHIHSLTNSMHPSRISGKTETFTAYSAHAGHDCHHLLYIWDDIQTQRRSSYSLESYFFRHCVLPRLRFRQ
jgi:hypothetical protein